MEFRTGLEGKPWYVAALLGLVLGVLVYMGAQMWLLKPRQESLVQLEGRLANLQTRIQEGRAARQQLPRFREEVRKLELQLDRLLRVLPARRNTPDLLRRIRALTEQGDFNLRRFTPGNFVDQDFYSEWPISISLAGTYHNLAMLFDRISRFSRVINVEGLRIESVKKATADTLHTIDASFTAKTFIYRDLESLDGGEEAQP